MRIKTTEEGYLIPSDVEAIKKVVTETLAGKGDFYSTFYPNERGLISLTSYKFNPKTAFKGNPCIQVYSIHNLMVDIVFVGWWL